MTDAGTFIVIEGIDAAGTTTQVQKLADHLDDTYGDTDTYPTPAAHTTKEPTDGPIGSTIKTALAGRLDVDPASLALLFAADRTDHITTTVDPLLADGHIVISDRYYHSSLAYQQTADQVDSDWLRTINTHARTPDLTIFLDISPEESIQRMSDNRPAQTHDKYEQITTLSTIRENYHDVIDTLSAAGEPIITVDGEQSISAVQDAIQAAVKSIQ